MCWDDNWLFLTMLDFLEEEVRWRETLGQGLDTWKPQELSDTAWAYAAAGHAAPALLSAIAEEEERRGLRESNP